MKIFTDAFLSEFKPLSVIIIKYGRISETKDSKADSRRKDKGTIGPKIRKGKGVLGKEEKGEKGVHKVVWNAKKQAYKAPKKGSQKETGKTTFYAGINHESGHKVFAMDKNKRWVQVRPPKYEMPRSNSMRTLDKKGKAKRKMG